jgi:hypothetical protein
MAIQPANFHFLQFPEPILMHILSCFENASDFNHFRASCKKINQLTMSTFFNGLRKLYAEKAALHQRVKDLMGNKNCPGLIEKVYTQLTSEEVKLCQVQNQYFDPLVQASESKYFVTETTNEMMIYDLDWGAAFLAYQKQQSTQQLFKELYEELDSLIEIKNGKIIYIGKFVENKKNVYKELLSLQNYEWPSNKTPTKRKYDTLNS